MNYRYRDVNINYVDSKNGKQAVVLLHGWGQNIEMMEPIANSLQDCRVIILDFPGFGKSSEPTNWGVDEYVTMLHSLLTDLKVSNPVFIGHSFGCRVAIKYSILYDVKQMVFTGAAGIRPKRKISYYFKVYSYKALKFLKRVPVVNKFINLKQAGSSDYLSASSLMKQTFIKVVNEDLTPYLSLITCPVLLIWGISDESVPLSDGLLMESLIKDSGLIKLQGGHYAYLQNIDYFNTIVKEFIKC